MLEDRGYPNWFSGQTQNFENNLYIFKNKKVDFLQIGAYLGHASRFMLENILTNSGSTLTDVDTWTGSTGSDEAMHKEMDWNYIEKKYEEELSVFIGNKLSKYKGSSDSFFENNDRHFDFIYIDGHHEEEYVQRDATNSFNFLKDGGIIAFDDCGGLQHIKDIAENLAKENNLEIITSNWQIWMRKA